MTQTPVANTLIPAMADISVVPMGEAEEAETSGPDLDRGSALKLEEKTHG